MGDYRNKFNLETVMIRRTVAPATFWITVSMVETDPNAKIKVFQITK